MKTSVLLRSAFPLLTLAIACGAYAQAPKQSTKRPHLQLAYMKTEPGRAAEYAKTAREYQLPVHQELVNQGKLLTWKVYEVRYPNGESVEYDYVALMVYPSLADLEGPLYGPNYSLYEQVHGAAKVAELAKTTPPRKLLRHDHCVIAASSADWIKASHPIVEAIYMKHFPGKGGEMLNLQRGYYLPVYEERIKAGTATGWATTNLRFPASTDPVYDAISFNAYGSLAQLETQPTQAFRDKWSSKGTEVNAKLPTLRKRIKGELWRLVIETAPTPTAKPSTE